MNLRVGVVAVVRRAVAVFVDVYAAAIIKVFGTSEKEPEHGLVYPRCAGGG
jgi:hypothetical protein